MLKCKSKGMVKTLIQTGDAIGGRNLLLGSNDPKTTSVAVDASSHLLASYDLVEPPVNGEMYTITIKLSNWDGMTLWGAWNTNGGFPLITGSGYLPMIVTQVAKDIFSFAFSWTDYDNVNLNKTLVIYTRNVSAACTPTVEWAKLEKGEILTDWTPAPEDIQSQLDELKAQIAALGG